jgi:cytochrome P450
MIDQRREAIKSDPKMKEKGDLLSIMLQDPLFENNDYQIVNESMTFFLASALTQATTISNMIAYMIQNPAVEKKMRESLCTNFKSFEDKNASLEQLAEELTIESLDLTKDEYMKFCLYESLRMDPPIPLSTSFTLTEDLTIGGVNIKAGEMMQTNIAKLHHLEDQWGSDHNQYKPERFADRGKHHPMSFIPFLAGKRVCAGKSFAENSMKVVLPLFVKAFSGFEFLEKEHY